MLEMPLTIIAELTNTKQFEYYQKQKENEIQLQITQIKCANNIVLAIGNAIKSFR